MNQVKPGKRGNYTMKQENTYIDEPAEFVGYKRAKEILTKQVEDFLDDDEVEIENLVNKN